MRFVGQGIGVALLVAGCAAGEPARQAASPAPAPVVAATAAPLPSGQHWLVGRWRGEIAGMASDSGRRTLVITGVAPDGTVTGRYQGRAVPMTLRGDALTFTSAGSGSHELRRTGPNEMQGTLMGGRAARGYTLMRE